MQLTRAQARNLRLEAGTDVWLRPALTTAPAVAD